MSTAALPAAPGIAHARAWRGLPALLAAILAVMALSTLAPERWVTGSNSRISSISSPKKSRR